MNFGKKLEKIRKGLGYTVDFNNDEIEYFTLTLDLFNTTDKEKLKELNRNIRSLKTIEQLPTKYKAYIQNCNCKDEDCNCINHRDEMLELRWEEDFASIEWECILESKGENLIRPSFRKLGTYTSAVATKYFYKNLLYGDCFVFERYTEDNTEEYECFGEEIPSIANKPFIISRALLYFNEYRDIYTLFSTTKNMLSENAIKEISKEYDIDELLQNTLDLKKSIAEFYQPSKDEIEEMEESIIDSHIRCFKETVYGYDQEDLKRLIVKLTSGNESKLKELFERERMK